MPLAGRDSGRKLALPKRGAGLGSIAMQGQPRTLRGAAGAWLGHTDPLFGVPFTLDLPDGVPIIYGGTSYVEVPQERNSYVGHAPGDPDDPADRTSAVDGITYADLESFGWPSQAQVPWPAEPGTLGARDTFFTTYKSLPYPWVKRLDLTNIAWEDSIAYPVTSETEQVSPVTSIITDYYWTRGWHMALWFSKLQAPDTFIIAVDFSGIPGWADAAPSELIADGDTVYSALGWNEVLVPSATVVMELGGLESTGPPIATLAERARPISTGGQWTVEIPYDWGPHSTSAPPGAQLGFSANSIFVDQRWPLGTSTVKWVPIRYHDNGLGGEARFQFPFLGLNAFATQHLPADDPPAFSPGSVPQQPQDPEFGALLDEIEIRYYFPGGLALNAGSLALGGHDRGRLHG